MIRGEGKEPHSAKSDPCLLLTEQSPDSPKNMRQTWPKGFRTLWEGSDFPHSSRFLRCLCNRSWYSRACLPERRLLGWNCEAGKGFICIQPRQYLAGGKCHHKPTLPLSNFSKTLFGYSLQLHLKAIPIHPCAQGF